MLDNKVDSESGKGLSTNDFTNADKSKLDDLENYDDANVKAEIAKTAEQTALNHSTLGYQAKNLYKLEASSEVKAGVTFTVNGEFVNVTGTTTGSMTKYVFASSENPLVFDKDVIVSYTGVLSNLKFYVRRGVDSASYKYNSVPADGYKVTAGDKISGLYLQQQTSGLVVSANNFGVMIRNVEITDDTYEPYRPSVQEQIDNITNQIFSRGISIPANLDLNNYTKVGVYYTAGASVSQPLANTPYKTGGFRLEVSNISTETNFVQKIFPNSRTLGCFFMRTYTDSSFGSWFKLGGEAVTTT